MTPEGKVKRAFAEAAKKYHLSYINLIVTGGEGDPDKLILPPGGRCLFAEFKSSGGELSPAQKRKIAYYRALGYRVEIIDNTAEARAKAREWATGYAI